MCIRISIYNYKIHANHPSTFKQRQLTATHGCGQGTCIFIGLTLGPLKVLSLPTLNRTCFWKSVDTGGYLKA